MALPEAMVTQKTVDTVHGRGQTLWAFSPDTEERWDILSSYGVDYMFVKSIDSYLAVMR